MVVSASKGELKWSPRFQGRREQSGSFLDPLDYVTGPLARSGERVTVSVCQTYLCLTARLYSPDPFTESIQESYSEKNRYKAG